MDSRSASSHTIRHKADASRGFSALLPASLPALDIVATQCLSQEVDVLGLFRHWSESEPTRSTGVHSTDPTSSNGFLLTLFRADERTFFLFV